MQRFIKVNTVWDQNNRFTKLNVHLSKPKLLQKTHPVTLYNNHLKNSLKIKEHYKNKIDRMLKTALLSVESRPCSNKNYFYLQISS